MPELAPESVAQCDPVWREIRDVAEHIADTEPAMAGYVHTTILNHKTLEAALSYFLAQKLDCDDLPASLLREVFDEVIEDNDVISEAVRADLAAIKDRDPACKTLLDPFLYFKGFQAVQTHRIAYDLWNNKRRSMALYLQSRSSEKWGVDIHPAAPIGKGILMDHATGIVIGETAVVEDDVSLLQGVTLGGTGKEDGDRHPKVRRGALIGGGAKVLGNIEIGECSRVGAGSVVLIDVPSHCTAAGVPAKIVGCAGSDLPSHDMDHQWKDEGASI